MQLLIQFFKSSTNQISQLLPRIYINKSFLSKNNQIYLLKIKDPFGFLWNHHMQSSKIGFIISRVQFTHNDSPPVHRSSSPVAVASRWCPHMGVSNLQPPIFSSDYTHASTHLHFKSFKNQNPFIFMKTEFKTTKSNFGFSQKLEDSEMHVCI